MARLLVTGGAGYIGSHTCIELLYAGYDITVVDNLSNSSIVAIHRVEELSGREVTFHRVDLLDLDTLEGVVSSESFDAVIHFAGLKAVGESVADPLRYYANNVSGTVNLLTAMRQYGPRRMVFSSSCTVYGAPARLPITEGTPLAPVNPYGRSKLFVEEVLHDTAATAPDWSVIALRYFNPVGAHPSGRIGEDPAGIPNNLMPYVMQVAAGELTEISVFGDDYDTPDGTGVRDYLHVVDLALGHLAALPALEKPGFQAVNLGTGRGHSVLEVIRSASDAVGRELPFRVVDRRSGDAACVYADATLARQSLGWTATRTLADMCRDHWNWQRQNPTGYR